MCRKGFSFRESTVKRIFKSMFISILILLLFLIIIFAAPASAYLTEKQVDKATEYIKEICPEYSITSIEKFIKEEDCPANVIVLDSDWTLQCDSGDYPYRCSKGTHYIGDKPIAGYSFEPGTTSQDMEPPDMCALKLFLFDINFYIGLIVAVCLLLILMYALDLKVLKVIKIKK